MMYSDQTIFVVSELIFHKSDLKNNKYFRPWYMNSSLKYSEYLLSVNKRENSVVLQQRSESVCIPTEGKRVETHG
jgi:hypothetical protein